MGGVPHRYVGELRVNFVRSLFIGILGLLLLVGCGSCPRCAATRNVQIRDRQVNNNQELQDQLLDLANNREEERLEREEEEEQARRNELLAQSIQNQNLNAGAFDALGIGNSLGIGNFAQNVDNTIPPLGTQAPTAEPFGPPIPPTPRPSVAEGLPRGSSSSFAPGPLLRTERTHGT